MTSSGKEIDVDDQRYIMALTDRIEELEKVADTALKVVRNRMTTGDERIPVMEWLDLSLALDALGGKYTLYANEDKT